MILTIAWLVASLVIVIFMITRGKHENEDGSNERFWSKVKIKGPDECWIWIACKDSCGHGRFGIGSRSNYSTKSIRAHQFAFWQEYGNVPAGKEIHHICQNPSCVNPRHLAAVTRKEHVKHHPRFDVGAAHRAKTHCPRGHPYSGDNLLNTSKGRACRACARINMRKANWKRRHGLAVKAT